MAGSGSADAAAQVRWSICDTAHFDHRVWNGEMVVFVCDTGDTHALDPAATLVCTTLLAEPLAELTPAAWLQRMIESELESGFDAADGGAAAPEELQAFEAALVSLHKLGLVKATEPVVH